MWIRVCALLGISLGLAGLGVFGSILSPCDYAPGQSSFTTFSVQGSLQWVNGPLTTDGDASLHGTAKASFNRFYQTDSFGYEFDGQGNLQGSLSSFDADLSLSGDAKWYRDAQMFFVGALESQLNTSGDSTTDLTGGVGYGRFRDVTPLVQAIRIQDGLLDLGSLLAPIERDVLNQVAQTIADVGISSDEKMVRIENLIDATGLVRDQKLGAEGLLVIERVMNDAGEGRLCGWDVQGRIGVTLHGTRALSEAFVLNANYANVPDPISQWRLSLRFISGLGVFESYAIDASATYLRRLGDQWRLKAGYTYHRDWDWSQPDNRFDLHNLSASVSWQFTDQLSLKVNGEIKYRTGDKELSESIVILFDYSVTR